MHSLIVPFFFFYIFSPRGIYRKKSCNDYRILYLSSYEDWKVKKKKNNLISKKQMIRGWHWIMHALIFIRYDLDQLQFTVHLTACKFHFLSFRSCLIRLCKCSLKFGFKWLKFLELLPIFLLSIFLPKPSISCSSPQFLK